MSVIDFCSFRDPSGIVLKYNGRILRLVKIEQEQHLRKMVEIPVIHQLIKSRSIPATDILPEKEFKRLENELSSLRHVQFSDFALCLEHEAIPFPSYPYEWAPEMLHCAAEFTLDICLKILNQNLGLKDATPYNILFRGTNPVFVDFLSFETRDPTDQIWTPYAQFVRTFLLPLLVNQQNKIPLNQIFLNKADGLEPENVYQLMSGYKLIKPSVFTLVTLPTLFSRLPQSDQNESMIYQRKKAPSKEMAKFILEHILKGLQKHVRRLMPKQNKSKWTDYFRKEESYSKDEFKTKEKIVLRLLQQLKPKKLLDVGCNTGHFSILAAQNNASVVAIDSDSAVIGTLWREARKSSLDILPLVVEICRPSPSIGWDNAEYLSFIKRSKGVFDTVLMLAVIHHMSVTSRIPFEAIAKKSSELTTRHLIIEFVSPEDPMFRKIVRGRDLLYSHLTQDYFESVWTRYFNLLSREQSGAHRLIYLFEKKDEK